MTILVGRGLPKDLKNCKLGFCENYIFVKQKWVKFSFAQCISKGILEYVHSDVWGLAPVVSVGGAHYILILINDKKFGFIS